MQEVVFFTPQQYYGRGRMTLFELLWFMFWYVGGAALGYYTFGHALGMFAGMVAGFAASRIFLRILNPHPNDWPICRCGAPWISAFSLDVHPIHKLVHLCNECGERYLFRRGRTWSRILPDATLELFMIKKWPRKWKTSREG